MTQQQHLGAICDKQQAPSEFFGNTAQEWEGQYLDDGLRGRMARNRMALTFEYLDEEQLPAGAEVLDLGCGPGVIAEELVERDFFVTCVDFSYELLLCARSRLSNTSNGERARFFQGDAQNLPFENDAFDVIVCIGVISWVEDPTKALHEIGRVLKPGGVLVITTINKFSVEALDPLLWWRKLMKKSLRRSTSHNLRDTVVKQDARPVSKQFSLTRFDGMLAKEGFTKTGWRTMKYGHFRWFGRRMPVRGEVWVDEVLERLWRVPIIRSLGWLYCVKAVYQPDRR